METIHRSEFVRLLKGLLPEAIPYLEGNRLNLTAEMMALGELAQAAIDSRDSSLVRRVFMFAETVFARGNAEVRNSLVVTVLEHLSFDTEAGHEALKVFPAALANARAEALDSLRRVH